MVGEVRRGREGDKQAPTSVSQEAEARPGGRSPSAVR